MKVKVHYRATGKEEIFDDVQLVDVNNYGNIVIERKNGFMRFFANQLPFVDITIEN